MLRALLLTSLPSISTAIQVSQVQSELSVEPQKKIDDHLIHIFSDLWTPSMKFRAEDNEKHKEIKAKANGRQGPNITTHLQDSAVGIQDPQIAIDEFGDLWTAGVQSRATHKAGKEIRKITRQIHHFKPVIHILVFIGLIVVGIAFEVYILKMTFNKDLSVKDALVNLGSWSFFSLMFLIYVGAGWGSDGVSTWLDGYILEMMLSVDNLFVFVLIMGSFSVPPRARSKVLMVGVLAALLLRVVMFTTIWLLVGWAEVINKALGAFIVYCAYKVIMLDDDDDNEELTQNPAVQILSKYFPITQQRDDVGSFFIDGKATSVFLAAGAMIFLDVIFAVDSVSAKTALIQSRYLSYTSTGFAMFALRALYYLLDAAQDIFEHLKYGVGTILALIGAKTMFPGLFFISDLQYLFLLVVILSSCMVSSIYAKSLEPQKEGLEEEVKETDGDGEKTKV